MKSISVPFSFSNGSVAQTSDITKITEQKIIDTLVTLPGERAINTGYGAGASTLLYEPLDTLAFDDFKQEAISAVNEALDSGKVIDITITYPNSPQMSYSEDSTIAITVRYIVPPYGGRTFSFNLTSDI